MGAEEDLVNRQTAYDPFARGRHPVGVRTIEFHDLSLADRPIPIEVWYPATDAYYGQDLADGTRDRFVVAPGLRMATQNAVRDAEAIDGVFPLVMYFHGGYGHQRECTHLSTHLASNGYVVAAPAFPGDNIVDLMPANEAEATVARTPIDESAMKRPRQASSLIEHLISRTGMGFGVDADRIGTMGFSMGGFTALAVNSVSRRPRAVFAMCPLWGQRSMLPQVRRLAPLLRVDDWGRPVATCLLTGELDPMVVADDVRLLHRTLALPKRLYVLARAGHLHWADGAQAAHEQFRQAYLSGAFPDPEIDAIALGTAMRPFAELCSEEAAGDATRALCLAHMDAAFKANTTASAFLDDEVVRTLAARGVGLEAAGDTRTAASAK